MDQRKNMIERDIQAMNTEALRAFFLAFESRFGSNARYDLSPPSMSAQLLRCFQLSDGQFVSLSVEDIGDEVELQQTQANAIYKRANELGQAFRPRAHKLAQDVWRFGKTLVSFKLCHINSTMTGPAVNSEIVMEGDSNQRGWTKTFKVINHLLETSALNAYYRRKLTDRHTIYMQAKTSPDGTRTCFYQTMGSIKDLVFKHTSKESNFEMYQFCCESRVMDNVVSVLAERPDHRMPFISPDRQV